MKKIALSLLAASLLPLSTSTLLAEEGQAKTVIMKAESSEVRFSAPDYLTVHSAEEEPMDWNYALVDEKSEFSFGIRTEALKDGANTVETLQAAFLANVHEAHDPKVTSKPDVEFTLADGSTKVKGYLYQSEYWGSRLVVAFPLQTRAVIIEFSDKTLEGLRKQEDTMKAIVETIEEVAKAK